MITIHLTVPTRRRGGFTLLELVVVIGILAILTGLLLPKFDVFKLKANKAVAASNMTDISRLIQTYYVQNAVYPDNWDSLMVDDTNLYNTLHASADGVQLEPQLVGGPPTASSPHKLMPGTALAAGGARSLARIGITTVVDANAASTAAPNERFDKSITRPIDTGTVLPTLDITDGDAQGIIAHIYPNDVGNTNNGIKLGKQLVVLGFGSHNTSIGEMVQEVPFYPNTDVTKYYSRFLAVFEVDDSTGDGARAELKAVIGADGDPIFDEMGDFYER